MLKILNTTQIREWDAYTIKNEGIASIDLMEKACKAFVKWFSERFDISKSIGIVCGTGNNGGDGLGIARLLHELGYPVKVWVVKGSIQESGDFIINKGRLPQQMSCLYVEAIEDGVFTGQDILIDGIFGSGLSRPLEGVYEQAVQEINDSQAKVVAIDIPSGLFADQRTTGLSVNADFTVTFQLPKLSFFLPENEQRVGQWCVVNIGLSKTFYRQAQTSIYWIEKKGVGKKILTRRKFSHKGDFGKALLVAGSYGMMGAAVLAARAAMKSGLGLLTVHVPREGYNIIQTAVPEAMASVDVDDRYITDVAAFEDVSAVGVGPGIGQEKQTIGALKKLLEKSSRPMVIDADGLNILSSNSALLHLVPQNSILTPHPGELKRLVGDWTDDFEKLEKAKALARQIKCILVLKGANTIIITPTGSLYFNGTGNPGMATAGSGDALSGILTGLLAQRLEPLDAAIIGVFTHGFAGDLAAQRVGQISLMASDIIDSLPEAFRQLSR